MTTAPTHTPTATLPAALIPAWPDELPLVALVSGANAPTSRFSIFAIPAARITATASATHLDQLIPDQPLPFECADDALACLTNALAVNPTSAEPFACPLTIAVLNYELGAFIEPTAFAPAPDTPLFTLYHCPSAILIDHRTGRTRTLGDPALIPNLPEAAPPPGPIAATSITSNMTSRDYQQAVARTIEYIRAGDIFQANIAHRVSAQLNAHPRAIASSLLSAAAPAFGAIIETPARTVLSLSPESLIDYRADSRTITTRPIKGTRPASPTTDLLQSEKDAAELAMIVDLMRNDLGRVARFGSIKVAEPRALETHGGTIAPIHHTTATVRAILREDLSRADLLRAVFPAGSITGAPKVRAMQIINELEPHPRGPYCGSILCADSAGNMQLSVSIRTASLEQSIGPEFSPPLPSEGEGGRAELGRVTGSSLSTLLTYHAGAGIVADSDPHAEWNETLTKAGLLRAAGIDPEVLP